MHCASCASNVERSLKKTSGVRDAKVSLMMKKAYVEFDNTVKEDELRAAVKKVGYSIKSIEYE